MANRNANPTNARRAKAMKKRERLAHVLSDMETAIGKCREQLDHEDPTIILRAANALFQGSVAYARVYEVGEIEERLTALETEMLRTTA